MKFLRILLILALCATLLSACSKSSGDSSSGDDDAAPDDDSGDDDTSGDDDATDDDSADDDLTAEGKCRAIWDDCFPDLKDLAEASCAEYNEAHLKAGACADAVLDNYFACLSSCEFDKYPTCAKTAKTALAACDG
ncbi:MAG: hypothetical protein H6685_07800 [Deltaproteobacteria bacterium]|nr:hypothetical protein [Deltaproteobacteria bacterium]